MNSGRRGEGLSLRGEPELWRGPPDTLPPLSLSFLLSRITCNEQSKETTAATKSAIGNKSDHCEPAPAWFLLWGGRC